MGYAPSRMTRFPLVLFSLRSIIFLVLGRFIPSFSRISCWKFNNHGAGMLPLTFKHGQLPPARDKATAERFDRGNNLLAIFRKHRLIVNRLQSYQVCCHVMLLTLTQAIADNFRFSRALPPGASGSRRDERHSIRWTLPGRTT